MELPKLECLVVVNVPNCYGGSYLWSKTEERTMRLGDGLFEVVGLTDTGHLVNYLLMLNFLTSTVTYPDLYRVTGMPK